MNLINFILTKNDLLTMQRYENYYFDFKNTIKTRIELMQKTFINHKSKYV